jgi:large subunit ribosomal protein L29
MKVKDIRQLSDEELGLELERIRRHLFDLRSQAVTEKLEDPTMLTKAKRDMARILTVQREREIAAAAEKATAAPAQAKA